MTPRRELLVHALLALAATLTAGTALGAVNLYRIQFRLEGVALELVRLHAAFQLDGLMGLFISGVALQALPRFWGTAPPSRALTVGVPLFVASSLVLRAAAVLARAPALVGPAGLAMVLGAGAFAIWVGRARVQSTRPLTGLDALLVFGAAAWPAGHIVWLAGEWPSAEDPLIDLGAKVGAEILFFGFLFSWLLGMAPRVTPFFTDLGHPRARSSWPLAALLSTGVTVRFAGLVPLESLRVAQAGQALIAAALLYFVAAIDRQDSKHLPIFGTTGAFRRALIAALSWCALAAGLTGLSALRVLAGGAPLSSLALDAARHQLAVGFALGLLIPVSTRLIPSFTGQALPRPDIVDAGLVALHAGVALRTLQALAPLGWVGALSISGLSGFLTLAAMLPWAGNILGMAGSSYRTARPESCSALPHRC